MDQEPPLGTEEHAQCLFLWIRNFLTMWETFYKLILIRFSPRMLKATTSHYPKEESLEKPYFYTNSYSYITKKNCAPCMWHTFRNRVPCRFFRYWKGSWHSKVVTFSVNIFLKQVTEVQYSSLWLKIYKRFWSYPIFLTWETSRRSLMFLDDVPERG